MKTVGYNFHIYHEWCFVCCGCKEPLSSYQTQVWLCFFLTFIFQYQGPDVYCSRCHDQKFADRCTKQTYQPQNKFNIFFLPYTHIQAITDGGLTFQNEHWHTACFKCTHCGRWTRRRKREKSGLLDYIIQAHQWRIGVLQRR